ncbi:uncharacterized protein LOC121982088 [Zingiber officinale]|uniref:uncharacterized protein LOC121982088 n=1 Tax=Zingiber officinale TaxID=94328 RepID=UPI001C4D51DF|nr:uncharacterized protein LOC121982088 [Zingiber officinale]
MLCEPLFTITYDAGNITRELEVFYINRYEDLKPPSSSSATQITASAKTSAMDVLLGESITENGPTTINPVLSAATQPHAVANTNLNHRSPFPMQEKQKNRVKQEDVQQVETSSSTSLIF